MTVAFSHDFGAGNWLGADTLISGKRKPGTAVELIYGRAQLRKDLDSKEYGPLHLASKLGVYGNYAIAWSGKQSVALDALHTIGSLYEVGHLRWEDIERELDRSSTGKPDEVANFLVQDCSNGRTAVYHFGEAKSLVRSGTESVAIGSGASDFLSFLSNVGLKYESEADADHSNRLATAHMQSQSTFGLLMATELMGQGTLMDGFGGFYETAREVNDGSGNLQYEKVGNASITYWPIFHATEQEVCDSEGTVKLGDVIVPASPFLTCNMGYMGDVAVPRSIRWPHYSKNQIDRVFALTPPHYEPERRPTEDEIDSWIAAQPLNSECAIAVVYGAPLQGNWVCSTSGASIEQLNQDGKSNRLCWIEEIESRRDFIVNGRLMEEVVQQVQQRVGDCEIFVHDKSEYHQ